MKNITNDYKTNIKEFGREIDSIITYASEDVTIELGKEQLNSVTPVYESSILKSVMKQLDIDSNVDIPLNTTLNYQFGVKVDRYNLTEDETYQDNKNYYTLDDNEYELLVKGTDYQVGDTITGDVYEYEEYEYINYGNYVVYSSEKQEDTNSYRLVCYDKMLYSMVDYTKMNITYPITIRSYIQAICDTIGLNFKNANDEFANYDKEIQNELYFDADGKSLGYKFRDVLDELAQVTGSTICINEETDELEIRYINEGVTYEEAEGTTIDLEDSIKHKLSNSELKGNTSQQTYTGKNLIPSEISSQTTSGLTVTKYSDGSFLLNGTTTATISRLWLFENKNIPLSAGTYTLSTNSTGTVNDTVYFVLRNTSNVEMPFTVNLKTQKYKTATLNNSANILQGYLYIGTGITFTNYKIYPMFTQENSMTSYEQYVGGTPSPNPTYPQSVNNVTGRQEIDIVGKNLLKPTLTNNGSEILQRRATITLNEDEFVFEATGADMYFGNVIGSGKNYSNTYGYLMKIPQNASTIYFSVTNNDFNNNYICFYDENKSSLGYSSITTSKEIPQNAKYFNVRIGKNNATTGTTYRTKVMVSIENTTYEPYIGKQYEINLGKNLLDLLETTNTPNNTTINSTNSNEITITATATTYSRLGITKQLEKGTYTISCLYELLEGSETNLKANTIQIMVGGSLLTQGSNTGTTFTLTDNSSVEIRLLLFTTSAGTNGTQVRFYDIQLEKGSTATTYSPYKTPIELCKIGDYKDTIKKSTGKNLFDKDSNIVTPGYINSSGNVATNDPDLSYQDKFIEVKPSTTYTISSNTSTIYRIAQYTSDKTFISRVLNNSSSASYTFTTPSNCFYIKMAGVLTTILNSIQIEKGETATEYEPHGKVWYLHKEIGKVVLNGSETWTKNGNETVYYCNSNVSGDIKVQANNDTPPLLISSHFKTAAPSQMWTISDNDMTITSFISHNVEPRIRYNAISTAADFKTWLSSNNTDVYYVLATATDTEITDEDLIEQLEALSNAKTYDGITHITVDGDLPSTLKISYANGYDLDTINEEYFKDINVNFGEKYGPINSIVLSRSAGADNVYLRDEESIAEDGLHELKISDNQIMNFNDRNDYLPDLLKQLGGLEYYLNDYVSTGITYYEMCDRYFAQIGDTKYSCVMFNDEVLVTQGLVENIHTDMSEESETDYSKSDTTDRRINQTNLIVNKQTGQIEALTTKTEDIEEDLSENYYTKTMTNQLIQEAETGVTNTFSEAGGNNVLRNTNFSATEVLETNQLYEYWYGNVVKTNNTNSANGMSILLQNDTLYQTQNQVANGKYTLSFYYKKLIALATCKVVINGKEYELTEDDYTLFQTGIDDIDPIEVNTNSIQVSFVSNSDNACEIYDIMLNVGTVKLAYSQNQNETITNTVNISKGITITASDKDVKLSATANGIYIKNKNNDDIITEFTDKGMTTKNLVVQDTAEVVGIYRQKVGNQIWDSLV